MNQYAQRVIPRALASIAPDDEKVIAALIDALRDKKQPERLFVAAALRNLGPAAKAAVPVFEQIRADKDEDRDLRLEAEEALQRIEGKRE